MIFATFSNHSSIHEPTVYLPLLAKSTSPVSTSAFFSFFFDFCLRFAQNILGNLLACDGIVSCCEPSFPAAILAFSDVTLAVHSFLSHSKHLLKAKALAEYAKEEDKIGRIQLIRRSTDAAGTSRFRRLELTDLTVREKVLRAFSDDELAHIFDTDGFFE